MTGLEIYSPEEIIGPATGLDNTKLPVDTTGFEIGTETLGPEETISSSALFFFCDFRKRNSS